MGPNYAAGRDMLQGLRNTYKGEFVGQEMTRWPGSARFLGRTVEGSRSAAGCALRILSGRRGHCSSSPNTCQSGLKGQIPLYQDLRH